MADENEVKALIARFWEVRQKLTADTSETTFWAIVAREALLWRDETRPAARAARNRQEELFLKYFGDNNV